MGSFLITNRFHKNKKYLSSFVFSFKENTPRIYLKINNRPMNFLLQIFRFMMWHIYYATYYANKTYNYYLEDLFYDEKIFPLFEF